MTDNKSKEPGFIGYLKGSLLNAFRSTPMGGMMLLGYVVATNPRVQTGINETVKDTVRDVGLALTYLGTLGNKQDANAAADYIEQAWHKHITKNAGLGEFRLGGGWKLPPNTAFNCKIDKDKEGMSLPMDAVFLKHKNGTVEVLDHNDPRYLDLAFPYVVGQVAIPIGAGKAMAAIKLLANGGKIVEGIVKGSDIAGKAVSTVNTVGGLGYAASLSASSLILEPEAIKKVAHLLDDPNKMTPAILRKELNTIFEKYAYLNGPMSEPFYVPSIGNHESPLQRLQDLSAGVAHKVFQSSSPFDRIEGLTDKSKHYRASIDMPEAKIAVGKDLDFQRGFLRLAQKSLSNKELSDQETLMLRFGMNIYTELTSSIAPQKGEKYSAAEKSQAVKDLEDVLATRFFAGQDATKAQILSEISDNLSVLDKKITERDRPKNPIIHNRVDSPFVMG